MAVVEVPYRAVRRAARELAYRGFDVSLGPAGGPWQGRHAMAPAHGVQVMLILGERRTLQRWVVLQEVALRTSDQFQGSVDWAIGQVREVLGREGIGADLPERPIYQIP